MQHSQYRYGMILLVALGLSIVGATVGVAADSPISDQGDASADEWRVVHPETGDETILTGAPPFENAGLEAGTYEATHLASRTTRTVSIGTISSQNHNTPYEVTAATNADYDRSIAPGDTTVIWIGVTENESALAETDLTLTLRKPDDTTTNLTATTDELGTARFEFDTTGEPTGRYEIDEVYIDGTEQSTYEDFRVGTISEFVPDYESITGVNEEFEFAIAATQGGEPAANYESTVQVYNESYNNPVKNITVETDESGFATASFTPSESGQYYLTSGRSEASVLATSAVSHTLINGDTYYTAERGEEVALSGLVQADESPLANAELTIDLSTFDKDLPNKTVTTDSQGVFTTSVNVPEDLGEFEDIRYVIYDSSGEPIGKTGADRIDVQPPEDDEGNEEFEGLVVSIDEQNNEDVLPGETKDYVVETTNNGTPISTAVTISTLRDYDGIVLNRQTVQTNDSGEAEVSVQVPSDVTSTADLDVQAAASLPNGDEAEDRTYPDISKISTDAEYSIQPGTTHEVEYNAQETFSAQPRVAQIALEDDWFGREVISEPTSDTLLLQTTLETDFPNYYTGEFEYKILAPENDLYEAGRVESGLQDAVTVTTDEDREYGPGDTVTLSISSEGQSQVSGIVQLASYGPDEYRDSVYISQGESVDITLPDPLPEEEINFRTKVMDTNGDTTQLYDDLDSLESDDSNSDDESDSSDSGDESGTPAIVDEDSVELNGSTVTVNHGGVSAVAIDSIEPTTAEISDLSGNGQSQPGGAIWNGPTGDTVTFTLTPPDDAAPGDTVAFNVTTTEVTRVTLEVTEEPAVPVPTGVRPEAAKAAATDAGEFTPASIALAINQNAQQGSVNGVEIKPSEFALIINANANADQ